MDKLLGIVHSHEMNVLHRVVQKNRLDAVKFLVSKGAQLMNPIDNGYTSLHLAVKLNHEDVVKELLKGKSREESRDLVNKKTFDFDTTLKMALKNNSLVNTMVLLSYGACFDYNIRKQADSTTNKDILKLFEDIEKIFKLLSNSPKTNKELRVYLEEMNSRTVEYATAVMYAGNSEGLTAMQFAMEMHDLNATGEIINFRIDKLKQNYWQAGPYRVKWINRSKISDYRSYQKTIHLVKLIHHSNAARLHLIHLEFSSCTENKIIKNGDFDEKVEKDVFDLLRNSTDFLKAYKVQYDPSLADQPLLVIIEESLQFFYSKSSKPFIDQIKSDKVTEIYRILEQGIEFTIKMLKICIIVPMQLFMQQVYSFELVEAAQDNDIGLVKRCLTGYPDLNKTDKYKDWTALHYALSHPNQYMAKLLLNFGADPTCPIKKEEKNTTTLHVALSREVVNIEIINLIFENISDEKWLDYVNARDEFWGNSALHLAANKEQYSGLVELLLRKGAIYCAKNCIQRMPIDNCESNYEIRELFKLTDRLFQLDYEKKTEELLQELNKLDAKTLLAVSRARDEKGLNILQYV